LLIRDKSDKRLSAHECDAIVATVQQNVQDSPEKVDDASDAGSGFMH
jgi:hypothetical protein